MDILQHLFELITQMFSIMYSYYAGAYEGNSHAQPSGNKLTLSEMRVRSCLICDLRYNEVELRVLAETNSEWLNLERMGQHGQAPEMSKSTQVNLPALCLPSISSRAHVQTLKGKKRYYMPVVRQW